MRTALACIVALFAALVLLFACTLAEVVFFKPHELGALLGTAFVYGRLILVIWIVRIIYKKVKGRQVIAPNEPASAAQTSTPPSSGSEEL
jgi:hypothetical protein